MLWQGGRESDNVEDRRGVVGTIAVGGGIIGILVLLVKMFIGGGDLLQIPLPGAGGDQQMTQEQKAAQEPQVHFVKTVLGFTEDVWTNYFQKMGKEYVDPKLVVF